MESKLTHINLLAFSSLLYKFNSNSKYMNDLKYDSTVYAVYQTFWKAIIQDYSFGNISSLEASKKMENWLVTTIKDEKDADWNFVQNMQHKLLPILFKYFADQIPGNIYWPALSDTYTSGDYDFADTKTIGKLFKSNLPYRDMLMDDEEKKVFDELPDKVTIYRGCSAWEIINKMYRYSWTLDIEVAEFFANKRKTEIGMPTQVFEMKVCKSKIIAYLDCREEKEIIYVH
jgi:hypothetical protein